MKKILTFSAIIGLLVLSYYWLVDARAGGWWSSSGWGGAIWTVVAGIVYAIYVIRRKKMIKKAKQDLANALMGDSSWNIDSLKRTVENIFMKYQYAWSEKNLISMEDYFTKSYFKIAESNMNKELSWKTNVLKDISIWELTLMSVRDNPGKDWDMFAMEVRASMIDYTTDETTKKFIKSTLAKHKSESQASYQNRAMSQTSEFKEYYIFIRHNDRWLLNNIKQKFSIVWDIIKLKPSQLKKILEAEKNSSYVDDSVFYK